MSQSSADPMGESQRASIRLLQARARLHHQLNEIVQFARHSGALSVLLVSRDGQELVSWHRHDQRDLHLLAALTAGQHMAREGLARLLGASSSCSYVLYEHEQSLIMLAPLAPQIFLVTLVGSHRSLGTARLALQRLRARLALPGHEGAQGESR